MKHEYEGKYDEVIVDGETSEVVREVHESPSHR
jgi:hypothetical protein